MNWLGPGAGSAVSENSQGEGPLSEGFEGVMRFTDDKNRTLYNGDYNNVQPRLGFAYAFNNKTSLRGAYGLFYVVSRHTVKGEIGTGFGFLDISVPWSLDSSRTQYATLTNLFPAGLTLPPGRNPNWFV